MVHSKFYWRKTKKQQKALERAQQERSEARQLLEETRLAAERSQQEHAEARKLLEDARLAAEVQMNVYKERLDSVNVCRENWQSRSKRYEDFLDEVIREDVLSPIRDGHVKAKMIEKLKGKASTAGCKIQSLFTRKPPT